MCHSRCLAGTVPSPARPTIHPLRRLTRSLVANGSVARALSAGQDGLPGLVAVPAHSGGPERGRLFLEARDSPRGGRLMAALGPAQPWAVLPWTAPGTWQLRPGSGGSPWIRSSARAPGDGRHAIWRTSARRGGRGERRLPGGDGGPAVGIRRYPLDPRHHINEPDTAAPVIPVIQGPTWLPTDDANTFGQSRQHPTGRSAVSVAEARPRPVLNHCLASDRGLVYDCPDHPQSTAIRNEICLDTFPVLTSAELCKSLVAARSTLMETLAELRTKTGWREVTAEFAQDYWTNINVSSAVLRAGDARESAAQMVSESIQTRLYQLPQYGGLLAEGNRSVPNTNLTVDSGIFMIRYGNLPTARQIADHVANKQLQSGAWSIALLDTDPRVRATSQVLRFLFELRHADGSDAYDAIIKRGLRWLIESNVSGTATWSNIPNDRSPNLSATIWALTALVNAGEHSLLSEAEQRLLDDVAREALDMGKARSWIGAREDASVSIGKVAPERVGSGAVSLTFFVPAYWRYINLRRPPMATTEAGLRVIFSFVRNLQLQKLDNDANRAVTVSEEGAATFTYNLGFALDAATTLELSLGRLVSLGQVDQILQEDNSSESGPTPALNQRLKCFIWLGWFGFLTLGLYELAAHSRQVPQWYQHRSSFTQGLLMAIIGVIIGGTVQLVHFGYKSLSRRRANDRGLTRGGG